MKRFAATTLLAASANAWESVLDNDPCLLKGTNGYEDNLIFDTVYITSTVYQCDITDGAHVLTWA